MAEVPAFGSLPGSAQYRVPSSEVVKPSIFRLSSPENGLTTPLLPCITTSERAAIPIVQGGLLDTWLASILAETVLAGLSVVISWENCQIKRNVSAPPGHS